MEEAKSFRYTRIEKILHELRYEIERGLMQREIDESMGYRFVFPVSKEIPNGVVHVEFRMRPMPFYALTIDDREPKLKVVK